MDNLEKNMESEMETGIIGYEFLNIPFRVSQNTEDTTNPA